MKVEVLELSKVKEKFPKLMKDPRDGEVYLVLERISEDAVRVVVLKVGSVGVIRNHLVKVGEIVEDMHSKNLEDFKGKIVLENK